MPLRYASLTLLSIALGSLALLLAPRRPGHLLRGRERSHRGHVRTRVQRSMRAGDLVDPLDKRTRWGGGVLQDVSPFTWSRIADVPEQTLDDIQARGEAATGQDIYNLNNIYRLRFNATASDVWALSARLEALPGILRARRCRGRSRHRSHPTTSRIRTTRTPPSPSRPASTPSTLDAAGWRRHRITICDLEYSWNYNHNDVTKALGSQINFNTADPFTTRITARRSSACSSPTTTAELGTKGVSFSAGLKTCGTYFGLPAPSWNVPGAIAVAIANLQPGDVILLEQQWAYTNGGTDYIPIEWWTDYAPDRRP